MRVLIYEPLPDMNRAPIIAQLAKTLMADGHDILVVLEEKLIYTLLGKLTQQGVINCSRTWRRHIGVHREINVYKLKTPMTLYWLVNELNFKERLQRVASRRIKQYAKILNEFAPEKIFVWNGQHEHLQDFMTLAMQTHEGRFVYMECGWFPQKGTIYFDTEGVNAASSIAKSRSTKLSMAQKSELETWRLNYLNNFTSDFSANNVFVPLQVETDTNITLYSPFKTMQEFVDHLETWIPTTCSATLRPHPLDTTKQQITTKRPNFTIDDQTPIERLINNAEYVVGINSTVLLEALVRGRKVIALGNGYLPKTSIEVPFESATISTSENSADLIYLLTQRQIEVAHMIVYSWLMDDSTGKLHAHTGRHAAQLANTSATLLHKTLSKLACSLQAHRNYN